MKQKILEKTSLLPEKLRNFLDKEGVLEEYLNNVLSRPDCGFHNSEKEFLKILYSRLIKEDYIISAFMWEDNKWGEIHVRWLEECEN